MSYKIGLIGCGRVGALLEEDPLRVKPASHLGGITKVRDKIKSIALCDINGDRLEHCSHKWDIADTYLDYKELFNREKPDIAVIATWTSTHKKIALYAIKSGVKGIVLEKPVATDLKQSREIIDACLKNNVKLVVNHERRWEPLYRKTKEIIDNKALGELKSIFANVLSQSWPRGSWEEILIPAGGGPLLHDGTHMVDILRYLTGNIVSLNGNVKREKPEAAAETTATAFLRSENGTNIFLEAGGMRNYFNFELDLHFEKGRMKVGNYIKEFYVTETSTHYTGFRDLVKKEFPAYTGDMDPFSGAILEVINALETDSEPLSSGTDGLQAMEIIFAIYYSASMGGKTVNLPIKIKGHPLKRMFKKGML